MFKKVAQIVCYVIICLCAINDLLEFYQKTALFDNTNGVIICFVLSIVSGIFISYLFVRLFKWVFCDTDEKKTN